MPTSSELRRLLSLVQFDARLDSIEGLTEFRNLLRQDSSGTVLQFLNRELPTLVGSKRVGIAFVLAEHHLQNGSLERLQVLYADDDSDVKVSVLNAMWGRPDSHPEMGAGIIQIALDAISHPSPAVRTQACSVIQNQFGWKVDVSSAVAPLCMLLNDESDDVRSRAACAVGNLAKGKYDMSLHIALLGSNLTREDISVRNYSAWALWQLSRNKHDIAVAVAELAQVLTHRDDWKDPRKNAIGALLHHAQKSSDNLKKVQQHLMMVQLDPKQKEIQRFLEKLSSLA